jgi:uncharacterized protein YbbC (DUF1343 family)
MARGTVRRTPIRIAVPRLRWPPAEHIARALRATLGAALVLGALTGSALGCVIGHPKHPPAVRTGRIEPGVTVLLQDSIQLVRGKRVGLLTNQTGIDRSGTPDADLFVRSRPAVAAGVKLVALFSPEHGLRGMEDRQFVAGGTDTSTRVPVYSLYGATVLEPPDSLLRGLDVLVIDLQDIGTRTWTYVASMVYAMRAASRVHLPVVVLDRPNPLTGVHADGPMLDSVLANAEAGAPGRPARPYALAPTPLRHGLTMGELALYYDDVLGLHADLHVVPARNWRRALWFDETGLPWVRPSPNLPSPTSALIYPALVAFEGTNVSVGRGTDDAFQRLGAPWLDARRVSRLLADREMPGVKFEAEDFTPRAPTDGKYGGRQIPGVRIVVTDRDAFNAGRVSAALLWAIGRVHADSLHLDTLAFDLRFGSSAARVALLRGEDPDAVIDRQLPAVVAFAERVKRYELYR